MRLLYGRKYLNRYRLISALLPDSCSVIELCCGCGFLYEKFLARRGIHYIGVDMLDRMLSRLKKMGVKTIVGDALLTEVDVSDYCIMLGSLYHFYPKEHFVLKHMSKLGAKAIVLEPIINYTSSKNFLISCISKAMSHIKGTSSHRRLNTDALDIILLESGVTVIVDKIVLDGLYRLLIFQR